MAGRPRILPQASSVVVLGLLALGALPMFGTDGLPAAGGWQRIPPARSPPAPGSMVYDGVDGYVLFFAEGSLATSSNCSASAQTWTYLRGNWTQLTAPVEPRARSSDLVAYDAADGYVLLFGGVDCAGNFLNDTWAFHAGYWTNITSSVAPPAREASSMTYDPADRAVLLFGGDGPTGNTSEQYGRFNDTWEFSAGHWRMLATPTSPVSRDLQALAFDASDQYAVLFGGEGGGHTTPYGSGCCLIRGDTWVFQGGTWRNVTTYVHPTVRVLPVMAYDPTVSALVLFGGVSGGLLPTVENDTWEFAGGTWNHVTVGSAPSPREAPALTFDSADGYLLLYGGANISGFLNDTWAFTPPPSSGASASIPPWLWVALGVVVGSALGLTMYARRGGRVRPRS